MERVSFLKWIGVMLIIFGAVVFVSWDSLCTYYLNKALTLSPSSKVYDYWSKSAQPIELDVYFFNVTNTEELENKDFKPKLVEMGPYRFREFQEKVDVSWNENNTVTYRQKRNWYFDVEKSVGTLEENITMLNMMPVTASFKARDWGRFSSLGLSASLKMLEKSIWVTRTAREFLFDGYTDPLLTLSYLFGGSGGPQNDRVGFLYGRNGTYAQDGYFNMETGQEDTSKIGLLRQWNFHNRTFCYDEGCDDARGYVGHFFAPNTRKEDVIQFFTTEFCKTIEFNYENTVEMHGVTGYRYVPNKKLYDNGELFNDTECNCQGTCMPYGILNITNCAKGVPMFASNPHFLDADPSYLEKVEGLHPDPSRSQFHLIVEPNLGLPIEVAAHVQYNILLEPNWKLSMFENVPKMVFPLLWMKKRVTMPEESASLVKLMLRLPTLGISCSIGLILIGLILVSATVLPRFFRKAHSTTPVKFRKAPAAANVVFTPEPKSQKIEEQGDKTEKEHFNKEDEVNHENEESEKKLLNLKETAILT